MQEKSKEEVLELLKTSEQGLTDEEAKARILKNGQNILIKKKQKTFFQMILEQLTDKMIIILLIAAVLSFFLREQAEGIVILVIVFINAFKSSIIRSR